MVRPRRRGDARDPGRGASRRVPQDAPAKLKNRKVGTLTGGGLSMRTKRWIAALALVVGGVLAGAAPAPAAAPVRQVFAGVSERTDDFCGFPVLARAEGTVAVIAFLD